MKALFPVLFYCLFTALHISAQDSIPEKKTFFRAKVFTLNAESHSGYLYAISDSALFLSNSKQPLCFYGAFKGSSLKFDYSDIEALKLHKKGKIWKPVVVGAVTGMVIGAVIGFAGGDDPKGSLFYTSAGDKALFAGTALGLAGGVTGLIIGLAANKTFVLKGKKERYNQMRNALMTKLSF
ncbi:MAG: hypothetical protein JST47_12670 [Bacteroidetes bacterium]|nr:hypothetical protein [Bacteroidota bacterium]MBS1974727.1 hypothetical protein [Bacteroidota bacterium]